MQMPTIDRTLLSLAETVEWVLARVPIGAPEPCKSAATIRPPWERAAVPLPREPTAHEVLLVLLRDGDLHAVGRYSSTPAAAWESPHYGRKWIMHSGRTSHVAPEQWRGGVYNWSLDALDLPDGQFIEIRVPLLTLRAIWPAAEPTSVARSEPGELDYCTPYLELMRRAIAEHGIASGSQPKKETLVAWFREQLIGGMPVSENTANHLATFVRMPEAQRGGNRKWRVVS